MWFNKKQKNNEDNRRDKIAASQQALLEATSATADAAQIITTKLRQRLEDSQRQFDSTARLLKDSLIVCDGEGLIKSFNPSAETMFLTTFDIIKDTSIVNLFSLNNKKVKDVQLLWNAIREGLDDGDRATLLGVRSNSEKFRIDTSLSRLVKQDGSIVILILIRDLTDFLSEQTEKLVNFQRFQTLFDLSFDGIVIVQNSIIVAANPTATSIFGIDSKSALDIKTVFTAQKCLDTCAYAGGICLVDGCPGIPQVAATRFDGIPMQLLFSSTGITWDDSPAHLVTFKDISNLHNLTNEMQNTYIGRDMICVFSSDFIIKFSNYYFNEYYGGIDNIGTDIRDLIPTSDRDTFSLKIHNIKPETPTIRNQVQHIDCDGTYRLLDWVDHAVFDKDGNIVEYQRTGRDITDTINKIMNQEKF